MTKREREYIRSEIERLRELEQIETRAGDRETDQCEKEQHYRASDMIGAQANALHNLLVELKIGEL